MNKPRTWKSAGAMLAGLGLTFALSAVIIGGCPLTGGGTPGPAGEPGANGADGANGANGADGATGATGATGETGPAGAAGPAGADGAPGAGVLTARLGTVVTVLDVNGGASVNSGDAFSVTFSLKTSKGAQISLSSLDRFSIFVSGPADHYQRVILPEGDYLTKVTENPDGTYTYHFTDAFPSVFAAPYNDSAAFGAADGELTGQSITAGTYTVGIEARQAELINGVTIRDAGDTAFDFSVGGAVIEHREVVLRDNCNSCHLNLQLHGGNRLAVTGCVLCHTDGGEDLISANPDKATPGVTIRLATMIHRLHRGFDLPQVAATSAGTDPYRYEIIGRNESVADFTDVEYPYMPGGTGFNQQTRNCNTCHGGAAQEAASWADENITRANCTSCHDDLDFVTGTILDPNNASVKAKTLTKAQLSDPSFRIYPGGTQHQFDDGACMFCHGAGKTWDVSKVHTPPMLDPNNANKAKIEITSVGGDAGRGYYLPGDIPTITFRIVDLNNNAIAIDDPNYVSAISFVMAGPVSDYQLVLPTSGTTATVKSTAFDPNTGAVTGQTINTTPNTGTGPFTYTAAALPATFRAPFNDSAAFDYAGGWGEMKGVALVNGSYTLALWGSHVFPIPSTSRFTDAVPPAVAAVRVGLAGTADPYPGFVTDAKCNACHGDLRFHGGGRKSVLECVLCHVSGAEDRPNVLAGQSQDPAPDTIDFKVMIHKIHNARNLDVVLNGGSYDLVGFAAGAPSDTGNVVDFSEGGLPSMPGGAQNCTVCHATDAWKSPVETGDKNIWKVACTSCHDGNDAAVHVQVMTIGVGQESCNVCHGAGAAFAVENVHAIP